MYKLVKCPSCTHPFEVLEEVVSYVCTNCGIVSCDKSDEFDEVLAADVEVFIDEEEVFVDEDLEEEKE